MTLILHQHPFAAYCWKALIALYERDVPFERVLVDSDEDRARLAALWPPAGMPVLVDEGAVVPESTIVVEHLDRHGDAPPLVPAEREPALETRLWDRVIDGQVMTPMQKIVLDNLRPEDDRDGYGVAQAHDALERAYALLDDHLEDRVWLAGPQFTIADCAAAPALHYAYVVHPWDADARRHLARYVDALMSRPSVARVVDEARPFRHLFPLPWPADLVW
jgi:glutathione S-transferase